ncbi:MAG: Lrp/AsnC family transcriptional regulator [Nanoarchaeota archaeon]|nr:Lrp/AsnC family transcriptional regulator [Nanoarchaeota archaeon]
MSRDLKTKDMKILRCLRKNSNQPLTDIARETGIPVTTIYDRMRLHDKEIIRKYTILLDFPKIGYHAKTKIALKTGIGSKEKLLKFLTEHPNVNSISKINLGFDFFIEVIFRDQEETHNFIDQIEEMFQIEEKHVFSVVDEIEMERFLGKD